MKESGHTPGPWVLEDRMDGGVVRADDPNRPGKRFVVCKIGPSHRSYADERMAFANADLIAAGPAMLAALKEAERLLDYLANDTREFFGPGTPRLALEQVRAAIAAAESE